MPFWSRKPKKPTFDDLIGIRGEEIRRLSNEAEEEGVSLGQLDLARLNALELKLRRILQLVEDHREDTRVAVQQEPLLLNAFPNMPHFFDRHANEAEALLRFVIQHQHVRFGQE